jgi:L-aspartate oxidase
MASLADRFHVPVLVLGSGIAGLTTAWTLARRGVKVLVLTKASEPEDCNTAWAQGGIIYFGKKDSARALVKDILEAGAGISQPEAVKYLATEGPEIVKKILLSEIGVPFTRTVGGDLDFTREGAHSVARIVHSADATGRAIESALLARIKAEKNIRIVTNATAIDLITVRHHSTDVAQRYALQDPCLGAYVLDGSGRVHTVLADFTVLATGGVGRLFLHTTNTNHAIGDGLAMAARAGAATMNLEYVQFHPTTLYHPDAQGFLISEALRGEGAVLVNGAGEAFMRRYAPAQKDLAPRDIVARAIVEEMTSRGEPCVFLDLAHHYRGKEPIAERFPTIAGRCAQYGIDISKEPIPVVPAAHYFCGGVLVDLEGKTTIRHLYAVGETSCTGVHGANRLASTSLLEGLVWGHHAALSIGRGCARAIRSRRRRSERSRTGSPPGTRRTRTPRSSSRTGPRSGTRCGTTSASFERPSASGAPWPTSATSRSACSASTTRRGSRRRSWTSSTASTRATSSLRLRSRTRSRAAAITGRADGSASVAARKALGIGFPDDPAVHTGSGGAHALVSPSPRGRDGVHGLPRRPHARGHTRERSALDASGFRRPAARELRRGVIHPRRESHDDPRDRHVRADVVQPELLHLGGRLL